MKKSISRSENRGFTLIELLVVVAIIGILATIVIWQYLAALDRAKQKKTMADMRSLGTALEARATDNGGYNAAGAFIWPTNVLTYDELVTELRPTYMKQVPEIDGWGRPLQFGINQPAGSPSRADTYGIRSLGKDGTADPDYDVEETTSFNCDIVYSNGTFAVHPKIN